MRDVSAALQTLRRAAPALEILTDGPQLAEKSHDYWMRSLMHRRLGDADQQASAVLRPSTTEQVREILEWAQQTDTAVVPFGLGSGVCGAVMASRGQVVVDMGAMADVLEIHDTSLTVTVQPGVRGSEFEHLLNRRGFTMGHFPQSIEVSTVGGWCSTRASGQFSTLYGNIEEMLLGCEVVLPGGRVVRMPAVPRAATGPDLKHLFLGSEGTLGIFTELTLRIHPLPEHRLGLSFTLPSLEAGIEALRFTLRAGWTPAVTRLYDAIEAGRNFSGIANEGEPVLLLMSEGPKAKVEAEAEALQSIVEKHGGIEHGPAPIDSWLEHRNDVPSFASLLDQGLVVDTIEVAAAWEKLPALWKTVVERGATIDGMIAMSGHVSHCYTQGANIYFTFVAAQADLAKGVGLYDRAWDVTLSSTHEIGGTIAHHHGIGRMRKQWLKRELGASYELLLALKRALDPKGIMNPGVLFDQP